MSEKTSLFTTGFISKIQTFQINVFGIVVCNWPAGASLNQHSEFFTACSHKQSELLGKVKFKKWKHPSQSHFHLISWFILYLYAVMFVNSILLMWPTLCRSKQCCQVLAIKDEVMNEKRSSVPRCSPWYWSIFHFLLKSRQVDVGLQSIMSWTREVPWEAA